MNINIHWVKEIVAGKIERLSRSDSYHRDIVIKGQDKFKNNVEVTITVFGYDRKTLMIKRGK